MLLEVSSPENFNQIINDNPKVCMEFFAPWCPHCQHFFPTVEAFAKQQEGKVVVAQTSLDKFPQLFEQYGVNDFPCVIYFQDGQPIARTLGDQSLQDLDAFLANAESQA